MLFNPKWVEPSLEGFRAFVAGKDPNEIYDWSDGYRCAVYQYAKAFGWSQEWHTRGFRNDPHDIWRQIDMLANYRPHTFGALLERIEAKIKG